jgi:hypothetical protein
MFVSSDPTRGLGWLHAFADPCATLAQAEAGILDAKRPLTMTIYPALSANLYRDRPARPGQGTEAISGLIGTRLYHDPGHLLSRFRAQT